MSPVTEIQHFLCKKNKATCNLRIQDISNETKTGYYDIVRDQLKDKNCIVIASSEVNPVTEISLGKIYGIEEEIWFTDTDVMIKCGYAVVGVKQKLQSKTTTGRIFSIEEQSEENGPIKRGFRSHRFPEPLMAEFCSDQDDPKTFFSYAHLLIAKNPFTEDDLSNKDIKYMIILNGICGPATFALTQILAGGDGGTTSGISSVSKEFVAYDNSFNPSVESEQILSIIIDGLTNLKKNRLTSLQYIFKVEIGPSDKLLTPEESDQPNNKYYTPNISATATDWRRVKRWELIPMDYDFFVPEKGRGAQ